MTRIPSPRLTLSAGLLLVAAWGQDPASEAPGPGLQLSRSCARCHSNAPSASAMRAAGGRGVAPYDLWQSTMMANAARDPLWRAAVSAEIAATPARRDEIERTCLSCHAPMADRVGLEDHGTGSLLHALDCQSELGELARDGVSCTICHGIAPIGLGEGISFNAGFQLDDRRRLFGPHDAPFAMPMQALTGFTPTRASHIRSSALCGSCHTLETTALDAEGHAVGARLLEQAPYLEWRNSAFNDELAAPGPSAASCQDCHVPTSDQDGQPLRTRIARNPGGRDFPPTRPRSPFGRHLFVGGNTLVLGILRDHADELGVQASAEALQATRNATRRQLRERSARVSIQGVRRDPDGLAFDVLVENLAGHKLPTAHPTRRAWLRVRVHGPNGELLFASGATDDRGRIVDDLGRPLPSELAGGPVPRHRDTVRSPTDAAVYGAVMADSRGEPTHTLMRGARWLVDNRILPRGWSRGHPEAARTAPVGTDGDANFGPGRDRVRYECRFDSPGPLTIEADLLYQPLSARWAAELMRCETPEVQVFSRLYETADRLPEVLATDSSSLE